MNRLDIHVTQCQIEDMKEKGIYTEILPELKKPILIAGFEGWGNALNISDAMVDYLISTLRAEYFGKIDPDLFYRYDENRPMVMIEKGSLVNISPAGGSFYAVHTGSGAQDLVILKAQEPNLRWHQFVEELLSLCGQLGVGTIITLGSMYDNVLHSDRVISGIASEQGLLSLLSEKNVIPINYNGPTAIHSFIQSEAQQKGFKCISLWCHCPYYLQGTTHFGILYHLGSLLSFLGNFELDVEELATNWKELNRQIQKLLEKNPQFQTMVGELRKAKIRGSWANVKESLKKNDKVISLEDFLKPG